MEVEESDSVVETVELTGLLTNSEDDPSDDGGDDEVLISDRVDNESITNRTQYNCGILLYKPKWLQIFARKKFFTLLLFLFALVEGAVVSGFTSVVLSSLEKRYHFTSTAVGFVAVSYDTVAIFSAIIVSYFGGRPGSHKPRWLGCSLLVIAIGSFVFASPQFLFGSYKSGTLQNTTLEQCNDERNLTITCSASNDIAYAVYITGNIFIAFGAASLYTLGPAFIDEIVLPKYVPLHLGIYQIGALVGPAFGYGLGSTFLLVYVDPWEDTDLIPSDPAWVGGWWIAFIFAGILSLLLSIPFLMYPKSLPDSHIVKQARDIETPIKYHTRNNKTGLMNSIIQFITIVKRLLTNLPFMFQTFSLAILFIVVTGMVSFGPQYFETQFHFSASTSGLLAGGVGITSACTGVMCGAIVIHFAKLRGRKLAAFITIVLSILVLATPAFLIHCKNGNIAGITTPYINGSTNGIDGASCNNGCDCTSSEYQPVCGTDNVTYFSPCRAGCHTMMDNSFSHCICIADRLYTNTNNSINYDTILSINSTVTNGICNVDCIFNIIVFFGIMLLTFFFAFFVHIPVIYFTIRVVADEDRSFALGLQSSFGRVFGSIPGPLLFGAIFDAGCIKWEDVCGRHGNCWIYNNIQLSQGAFAIGLPCVLLSAILSLLAWITHPKNITIDTTNKSLAIVTPLSNSVTDNNGDQQIVDKQ